MNYDYILHRYMFRFQEILQIGFSLFQKQINFHGIQNSMIIYFFIEHINEFAEIKWRASRLKLSGTDV